MIWPYFLHIGSILLLLLVNVLSAGEVNLNGYWEAGENRIYNKKIYLPGLFSDPDKMNENTVWFRKEINLPAGNWSQATLILKGALFSPSVWINGTQVSQKQGGMAPTSHFLNHKSVKPDSTILLEIALQSLKNIPETDASYVAVANHWRSNISSLVWDDIILETHGCSRISRIIPHNDIKNDLVKVFWEIEQLSEQMNKPLKMTVEITDRQGNVILKKHKAGADFTDALEIQLQGRCRLWSPDDPNLYRMNLILSTAKEIIDRKSISYALKEFKTEGLQFRLNNKPCKVRAGTVVWHRWIRDPEAKELAFNQQWFFSNVVQRLKDHGANTLRFHLGNPPEAFLDLCDQYGLLVQYEWSFFHGMPASKESLISQWRDWLDLAMRHPSVSLIHPYNETSGKELEIVWSALDALLGDYPPLVMEERDVIHIHKYWWSMFENVGLYYDAAAEFPKPVMVDEFGGNYLDGYGRQGGYKTLKESFLRFCGREQTADLLLYHHTVANSQIAEYWRRIGAAGFSPFCILGSREDGNHWYMGPLKQGIPKPVWSALTAAYSPVSLSLEVWDRNYYPEQQINIPLHLFNDTDKATNPDVTVVITDERGRQYTQEIMTTEMTPFSQQIKNIPLRLPAERGPYTFQAILNNPPSTVKYPVISQWDFRIMDVVVPLSIKDKKIGLLPGESELQDYLNTLGISTGIVRTDDVDIILGARKTWEKISSSEELKRDLYRLIQDGTSLVLLDVGPQYYGQGYADDPEMRYGFLQGRSRIQDPVVAEIALFGGITLNFRTVAEPESHIHPSSTGAGLWFNLEKQYTWLWNGMRGGLIVPAVDMRLNGLRPAAFRAMWKARGADGEGFKQKTYFAYELEGYYGFSPVANDTALKRQLRDKVKFIVEDAPSLAGSVNPQAEITITDLSGWLEANKSGEAEKMETLVICGPNLSRAPVVRIDFGEGCGSLLISQLITAGRLAAGAEAPRLYAKRYDPVAAQFVLNMLAEVIIK